MGSGEGTSSVVLAVDGVEVAVRRVDDDEARADLTFVDAVARLDLAARRFGWSVRVRNPCGELRALLELVGLADLADPPAGPAAGGPA